MTRNSSSSESAAPDAQKEQIEVTPPSTAQQAQQATSFNVEPISKDGFHIHERDADETNSSSGLSSNPFEDPDVAEHWAMVYEKAQYECRGEFDPTYTWTPEEEKRLIRKLDFRVCAWACVMFFGLQVDRGNLKQAVSDNMLDDLNLNTNGTFSFLLREREREKERKAPPGPSLDGRFLCSVRTVGAHLRHCLLLHQCYYYNHYKPLELDM